MVLCEQIEKDLNLLVFDDTGNILERKGYKDEDVAFLKDFVSRNLYVIKDYRCIDDISTVSIKEERKRLSILSKINIDKM